MSWLTNDIAPFLFQLRKQRANRIKNFEDPKSIHAKQELGIYDELLEWIHTNHPAGTHAWQVERCSMAFMAYCWDRYKHLRVEERGARAGFRQILHYVKGEYEAEQED